MFKLKWLYLGIGIKRWFLLILLGLTLISSGLAIITDFYLVSYIEGIMLNSISKLTTNASLIVNIIAFVFFVITGIILVSFALKKIILVLSEDEEFVDNLYQKKVLEKGPKIVALGGGTGLSTLLRGIKEYTSNITAIVTVADDGGSSGKLREDMGILAPGDIRNCLLALADTEPLMKKLFQYRFDCSGHLLGHSFGNLFIASLTDVLGDFEEAIKESSKVLAIRGKVLPATNQNVSLGAIYQDNSIKKGESIIPSSGKIIKEIFLEPKICHPSKEALLAIKDADIILIGPGSLYTSIIPNLLIEGISEAISKSSALKMYICNVMTQAGETDQYTASEHIKALIAHSNQQLFDYIILNKEEVDNTLGKKYEAEGAFPVEIDRKEIEKLGKTIIEEELLSKESYVRHNPHKLAKLIINVYFSNMNKFLL